MIVREKATTENLSIDEASVAYQAIFDSLHSSKTDENVEKLEQRALVILQDVRLLARCAQSECLITYSSAIDLRGHGNAQSGKWLDDVYTLAVVPLGFPDLTMLVVSKETRMPSADAFEARRARLSMSDVSAYGSK